MATSTLHLDLHPLMKRGSAVDEAVIDIIETAARKRVKSVEIIPGKGSGQLRNRVLRLLRRKDIKALYHRIEIDSKNHGRLFVHFK